MRAVRFDRYGDESVLEVREVPEPVLTPGRVLVRVLTAAINPGEAAIRSGEMSTMFPATFPSGEGSDFAGRIVAVADDVEEFSVGDEVFGYTDERASHAEVVSAPAAQVVMKPPALSWDVAGSMFIAPFAGLAGVLATNPGPGDTVLVSGATGGAGFVAAQLARNCGADVVGIAGRQSADLLREHGIAPVLYGDGVEDRVRAATPQGVTAVIDCHRGDYLDLGVRLGVDPSRMNTLINFDAAARIGASTQGSSQVVSAARLADLADDVVAGTLVIPIAATYSLDRVQDAYRDLAARHAPGKIVLRIE